MATYSFTAISEAEALAIGAADTIEVATGTASQTTVSFVADGRISITVLDRTVVFGAALNASPGPARLQFADGSRLFIGDVQVNAFNSVGTGAMYGGDGADSLTAGDGVWLLQGNQGDDSLLANPNFANVLYGGQGNDFLQFAGPGRGVVGQFAQGNKGDDSITGGNGGDVLLGGQGNDSVRGNIGIDFINGNLGDDTLSGSGQLLGEAGNDSITASTDGANTVQGGDGDDRVMASVRVSGEFETGVRNTFFGDAGNDTLISRSPEHDELFGGDGNDILRVEGFGPTTGDLLEGGAGNDALISLTSGPDTLRGGDGLDGLLAGAGRQVLDGGAGSDTLNGGAGVDTLIGGAGSDRFVLQDRPASNTLDALDRILDWSVDDRIALVVFPPAYVEAGASDMASALNLARLTLADGRIDVAVIQIPEGVVIFTPLFEFGPAGPVDAAVLLVGRTLADISQSNFT